MQLELAMYQEVSQQETEKRIQDNLVLVKRIAYHLIQRLPNSIQVDDLIQAGMIGLLEAARNYDASQGASFETYAGIRIRGAMLDEVRHSDWSPRSLHRKMRDLSQAMRAVEQATGRDARDGEVAEKMGISLDEYYDVLRDCASARLFSLDEPDEDGQTRSLPSDQEEPMSVLSQEGFQQALVSCIAGLPEREQLVMSLYYTEELNLKEIGSILEVSESRVCQIHAQALARIRSRMADWVN